MICVVSASAIWKHQDISEVLVRQGPACDCVRFSGGRYRAAETQAAAEGATIRASYPLPG